MRAAVGGGCWKWNSRLPELFQNGKVILGRGFLENAVTSPHLHPEEALGPYLCWDTYLVWEGGGGSSPQLFLGVFQHR